MVFNDGLAVGTSRPLKDNESLGGCSALPLLRSHGVEDEPDFGVGDGVAEAGHGFAHRAGLGGV